jgi:hypothetical protein
MKKKAHEQRNAELKHMLHMDSRYISEVCPNIESIEIKMQFTNPDDKNTFEKNIVLKKDMKAYFKYDCPYRECINGGYDLNDIINKAIESPNKQAEGKLICQGWQDKERVNKHKCLLEALVKIKINL